MLILCLSLNPSGFPMAPWERGGGGAGLIGLVGWDNALTLEMNVHILKQFPYALANTS